MSNLVTRSGIVLAEIHGVYLLVADREARKSCAYVRQINEIGAFIWKQLEERKTRDEILLSVRREYDIPKDGNPDADVDSFIRLLTDSHYLINEADEHAV